MDKAISPPPTKKRRVEDSRASEPLEADHGIESLSIYSWNINGISPFIQRPITSFFGKKKPANPEKQQETPYASLRGFLRRHDWPTCLLLQEVKINPDDEATIRAVERAVQCPAQSKGKEPDYQAFFCLPNDAYNARGFGRKVYGVCSIVRQDFLQATNAKARTVPWDKEGRFSIIETEATKDIPKLSIINIYAVNGTDNPYKDPITGQVSGTRHDRKLAVHKLLLEECQRLESEGFQVIVAGDMNVARNSLDGHPNLRTSPQHHVVNRADFNAKFFNDGTGLRAVDSFRSLHGDKKGYTYYPRGRTFGSSCDRVCTAS